MIYVTGDTHGLVDFEKLKVFAGEHPELTEDDYVIIAGDCGVVWNDRDLPFNIHYYKNLPFTVLFVDGNHENFYMLNEYPVEDWKGGKVHFIATNIIHLMRGQIFNIDGKTIFTFGGGTSIDKAMRREGISWWAEEMPSFEELDEAFANLKKYDNKVDYIITHSCDEKALYYPALRRACSKALTVFPDNYMLSNFEDITDYKHWYFGHYHVDCDINYRKTALYQKIIPIGNSLSE